MRTHCQFGVELQGKCSSSNRHLRHLNVYVCCCGTLLANANILSLQEYIYISLIDVTVQQALVHVMVVMYVFFCGNVFLLVNLCFSGIKCFTGTIG